MSKKPSLSSSGSLASCLHFAAKLLSPSPNDAPPAPEALTKDVLAPIVVDAHRFGLQMTKLVSETTGEHNPRKLLHLCREKSDDKVQKTLNGIAVADITWDFQGSVVDTLEMELEDLLQRAQAAGHSICALFSISTPEAEAMSAGAHALVWVPEEKDSSTQKHSMLLYVCPGRVKVVKTVGDLVRKMREEIKMIQDSDASFCVWSIITAPKTGGRRQSQSKEIESVSSTDAPKTSITIAKVDSPVRSIKDTLGEEAGNTQHTTVTSHLTPFVSRELVNNNNNDADGATTGSRQETQDGTAPPAKQPSSKKASIFCFSHASSDLNVVKSSSSVDMTQCTPQRGGEGRELADDEPGGPDKDARCEMGSESPQRPILPNGNQEEDDARDGTREAGLFNHGLPSPSQEQQPSLTRAEWLAPHNRIPVSRSSVTERRPHHIEPVSRLSHSTDHAIATSGLELAQCRLSSREEVLRGEPSRSLPQTRSKLGSVSPIQSLKIEDTSEAEVQRIPPTVYATTSVRVVVEKPPASSIFAFTGELSCDRKRCAKEPDAVGAGAEHHPDIGSHGRDSRRDDDVRDSTAPALTEPVAEPSSPVVPLESRQSRSLLARGLAPDSPQPGSFPMMNSPQEGVKKSARDRVRSKLGVKVWWELEYTARQLELEAAQSQGRKENSSDRPRGAGLLCDAKVGAKWLTTRPSLQAPATQEASANRAHTAVASTNTAPPASVLGAIKEEHSIPTPTARSSSKDCEFGRMTPPPSKLGNIHAVKDAQDKRVNDSCRRQTVADDTVSLGSRGVAPLQQHSSSCQPASRSTALVRVARPTSLESSCKMQVQASASDIIPVSSADTPQVSLWPSNGGARFEESTPEPSDYRTGSCKPRPQSTLVVQAASETQTSASTKEASPTAGARRPRDRTPLHHSSRSVPQERSSPAQTLYEHGGQCQLEQSDCDDGIRERNGDTHRHLQSGLTDEECNPTVSQAQTARARSNWDPLSVRKESPVETPTNLLVADHKPSSDVVGLPFHVNGRVPIRTQLVHPTSKSPSNYPVAGRASPGQDEPSPALKEAVLQPVETTHEGTSSPTSRLPRPPAAAATATFISFHDDKTVVSAGKKEAAARMDRLNELRQKKLDQLHKTREQALQQQHEKKQKQQDKKPTVVDTSESSSGGTTASHHTHHQPRVKRATNRQQLQNAIEFTLLAGQSNERERHAALETLAQSTAESFVVLLKSAKELKFRALYESRTESDDARRIYSVVSSAYAPLRLTPDVVAQFFKYSSAKKQFLAVDTRSFTVTTDACALGDHLVFKKTTKPRLL